MKKFIFSKKNIGSETVKIGNVTYKMLVGEKDVTFHVLPDHGESYSIDLSFDECKALYLLLTIEG
jgi:hypothetical protein